MSPSKTSESLIPGRVIVLIGNFNPHIIQTAYMRRYKVFPEQEIAAAEELVRSEETDETIKFEMRRFFISPVQTVLGFKTFELTVLPVRLQLNLKADADAQMILSGLKKLFSLLIYTPVTAVGYNFDGHWKISGGTKHLKSLFLGNPDALKSAFGKDASLGGKIRYQELGAKIMFDTEPSVQLPEGVHFSFNYHFDIPDKSAQALLDLLPKFHKCFDRANETALDLFGKPLDVMREEKVVT